MIYDPNNELSAKELDTLAEKDFDEFLNYLDQKSEYLKQFTKPLDAYHLKRYASQTKIESTGESLTTDEIKKLEKLGEKNDDEFFDETKHKEWIDKRNHMLKSGSLGIKNIKTNRSQWFD